MIRIKDILQLAPFQGARLLAGRRGLDNEVVQVSIADIPSSEMDYKVSKRGDFYLSSFYFARESLTAMYQFFQVLIDTGSSGLCLIDEYVTDLPEEIRAYCDEKELPVLLVDQNISYADMIKAIMERIILYQQQRIFETQISILLSDSVGEAEKLHILSEMNPHFQNDIMCIYVISASDTTPLFFTQRKQLLDLFNHDIFTFATEYKNGILIIYCKLDDNEKAFYGKVNYIADCVKKYLQEAVIGVSNHYNSLSFCTKAIHQAIAASGFGTAIHADDIDGRGENANRMENSYPQIVYYKNLGVLKLLLPLKGHVELNEFCEEILSPIMFFDQKNNGQLLDTLTVFLRNDRDYKKTAKDFFLHENTIRYRIAKAKELVNPQKTEHEFFECFSIALKIRSIHLELMG